MPTTTTTQPTAPTTLAECKTLVAREHITSLRQLKHEHPAAYETAKRLAGNKAFAWLGLAEQRKPRFASA